MWLLANIIYPSMLLAGIALLIFILFRRIYGRSGRRRRTGKTSVSHLARAPRPTHQQRSLSNAPSEVLKWHGEMHETARDLKAELDSKMRVLQILIGQARQEADRLERVLGHLESAPAASGCSPAGPPSGQPPLTEDRQAKVLALADQGCTAVEIAEHVGTPVGEVELILNRRHR